MIIVEIRPQEKAIKWENEMSKQDISKLVNVFVSDVRSRLTRPGVRPEPQLSHPVQILFSRYVPIIGCLIETELEVSPDEIEARPDMAIYVDGLLCGYIELKAPGKGANPIHFSSKHDRDQWQHLKKLPNLIYTDGTEWALYRDGEQISEVFLSDVRVKREPPSLDNIKAFDIMLRDFLSWQPTVPKNSEHLAEILAPLCRIVRDEVLNAMKNPNSSLNQAAEDWRRVLFPEATNYQFADAYAQTLTYALLLARLDPLTQKDVSFNALRASEILESGQGLLAQTLRVLVEPSTRKEIGTGISLLERAIGAVNLQQASGDPNEDIWLYFYEYFLAHYDPELREQYGVYLTPVQVVKFQVGLISEILTQRMGKTYSFADDNVTFLDPAVGTGTYLLNIIDKSLNIVRSHSGPGAVPGRAEVLANNMFAFERLVGPYAVASLRVTQRLRDAGVQLTNEKVNIYLTDTLEFPESTTAKYIPLSLRLLSEEHNKAILVKKETPILICLGNPPYERQSFNVRSIDKTERSDILSRLLGNFLELARGKTMFSHLASLYNDYVYFWHWALWKVFETGNGPGIVSFITASSYLTGPGFVGMREHLRRLADEIWIIDLEGGMRGSRRSENVFAIGTPVAIAIAVRYDKPNPSSPAKVYYTKISGSRKEKLDALNNINSFQDINWDECPNEWGSYFIPIFKSSFITWPLLKDLFPWQTPGVKVGRTWPIAPLKQDLIDRWIALVRSPKTDRPRLFPDKRFGRRTDSVLGPTFPPLPSSETIMGTTEQNHRAPIVPYSFRSFDRKWILADPRIIDLQRPPLWYAHSEQQIYLTSILTDTLGKGPAATVAGFIPDIHHFNGRGGKDIIPLWRDPDAKEPNITHGLLEKLESIYNRSVTPEDFLSYCYAILTSIEYTDLFQNELETSSVRVPITTEPDLFFNGALMGRYLIWLHTYAQRFDSEKRKKGVIPPGKARAINPISSKPDDYPETFSFDHSTETLFVGSGTFYPVSPDVWNFEISGRKPLSSWLGYRKRNPAGKKSSELDHILSACWSPIFTRELLELIWLLEATIEIQPDLTELLERIVLNPILTNNDISVPTDREKKGPQIPKLSKNDVGLDQITLY